VARLRVVKLSRVLLPSLFTKGATLDVECVEGLPDTAEFVFSYFDGVEGTASLVFHDESFEDILPGDRFPVQDVTWRSNERRDLEQD